VDHVLARFGVAEPFAGQTFDSHGILQGAQLGVQFPGGLQFPVDFLLQFQLLAAHALIFLDDWLVPEENAQQAGEHQQRQHQTKQLVPNALTRVHGRQLTTVARKRKAGSFSNDI